MITADDAQLLAQPDRSPTARWQHREFPVALFIRDLPLKP
jgi:hypothetical protein